MKKLLFFVLLTLSVSANSALLIEPYIGYMISSGDYELTDSGSNLSTWDASTNAPVIGARLGYKSILGIFFAVDYSMYSGQSVKLERSSGSYTYSATSYNDLEFDGSSTNIGLTAGIALPLIRAYATYFVSSKLEVDETPTPTFVRSGDEFSGDGFGLGVSLGFIPFISINFEYRAISFDAETLSNNPGYKMKPESNEILISLSVPLSI